MTDTPFWRQVTPDDGDLKLTMPAEASEGDDVLTINGHEFKWTEGVRAEVKYTDDDGRELGAVYVPYDPDNQPSEEDMLAEGDRLFHDMEHMRSIVKPEAIDGVVRGLHKPGTAGERAFADVMVETVADALRGSLKLTVTDDDGREGLTPEQLNALASEGERLFDEQLPQLVREMAETPTEDGLTFWQQFARDIVATATLHARDDVTEDWGGHEVVAALDDASLDAWEERVLEAYRTGPYLAGAMLSLSQEWLTLLGEIIAGTMTQLAESEEGKELIEPILKAARKSLKLPEPTTAAQTPAALTPAFDADGYGRVANDLIAQGTRYMMVAPWTGPRTGPPEFHFRSNAGAVTYGIERALDSLQDAWAVVDRLDDGHADLFDFILAKMLASMAANSRDIYGDFTVTRSEILDARFKKHHKGGHRPEHIREVVAQMHDLNQIRLRAELWRHPKSKRGGNPQRIAIEHAVKLIVINETIDEVAHDGERLPLAWNMRPGNWTRALEGFTEQYALMMHGILKLHGKRDRNAKRIGRYLIAQYRIRAYYKNWAQGYDVRTILDGAGIDIPTRNKPRFKQSFEAALDTLASSEKMHGPVCIDTWRYSRPIDLSRADWFECWLDTAIIIMPTAKLMAEQYRGIGVKRQRKLKQLVR